MKEVYIAGNENVVSDLRGVFSQIDSIGTKYNLIINPFGGDFESYSKAGLRKIAGQSKSKKIESVKLVILPFEGEPKDVDFRENSDLYINETGTVKLAKSYVDGGYKNKFLFTLEDYYSATFEYELIQAGRRRGKPGSFIGDDVFGNHSFNIYSTALPPDTKIRKVLALLEADITTVDVSMLGIDTGKMGNISSADKIEGILKKEKGKLN